MPHLHRRRLMGGLLAAPALALASPLRAQGSGFPARPVVIVDGFPPGGGSDIVARQLGRELEEKWGKPVVVENRSGAAGTVGAASVARAEADGHTLLMAHVSTVVVAPRIYPTMAHADIANFTPISMVAAQQHVFVVAAGSPLRDMAGLLELARDRAAVGRPLTYGASVGGVQHLAVALFSAELGIELQHVPYRGSAPAIADLMAGTIDFIFEGATPASPFLKGGQLRGLAVSGERRLPGLDAPTLSELRLPAAQFTTWWALVGPRDMAPARRQAVAEAVQSSLRAPRFVNFADGLGVTRGLDNTGARLDSFVGAEGRAYADLIKRLDIKPE